MRLLVLTLALGACAPEETDLPGPPVRYESDDCDNDFDEDGDGHVDCDDQDCDADPACAGPDEGTNVGDCSDDVDNDDDGLKDCADAGCEGAQPCSEGAQTGQCTDERDNDGDALVDCADPGCVDAEPGWCACARYVAAAIVCIEASGGDPSSVDVDDVCRGYSDADTDYFTCLAEAYEGADCTTLEGLTQAGNQAARCS